MNAYGMDGPLGRHCIGFTVFLVVAAALLLVVTL